MHIKTSEACHTNLYKIPTKQGSMSDTVINS